MLDKGNSWFDLGALTIACNDEAKDNLVQMIDHPYLLCDSVMFERTSSISRTEWDSLMHEKELKTDVVFASALIPRLLKLGLLVCVAAGSWWGWRQAWWRRIWTSMNGIVVMLFDLPLIGSVLRFLFIHKIQFVIWSLLAIMLYGLGLMRRVGSGENYCFTFGGIAVVLAWRSFTRIVCPWLKRQWPAVADKVYGGSGTHYIVGFMFTLIGAAVFLILKLEPIAEQLAVVGYYMLVAGVVLEAWALRRNYSATN